MASTRPLSVILDYTFNLGPGQEQDFGPYPSHPNGLMRVHSRAVPIHYVAAVDAPRYLAARRRPGRFPFPVGTGKPKGHDLEYQTTSYGQFYIVVRASGWNVGSWPYRVWVEYG